jgi:transposase
VQSPIGTTKNVHLSNDVYKILTHVYGILLKTKFEDRKYRDLKKRDLLMKVCGVSEHVARKAIHMYNHPAEASEYKPAGRPRRSLDPEYSSAIEEIILYNNESGKINTVKRTMKMLEDSYQIKVLYNILLRDIHILGFKYEKGIRRTILHDSSTNMLYRELYVNQRLANINDKFNPNQPELFLDESYCHIDHSTGRTWVRPRGVVNESGRKPILVIFAAFIVFKEGHERKAEIIQESVNVWPVQDNKNLYTDYHGHFNAKKFERLFDTICHAIQPYGSCIIHMDGASYHKRRTNPVPTAASTKSEIINWFLQNNLLVPSSDAIGKVPTKKTLLQAIKDLRIKPQFACYDISTLHGNRLLFTPPYHPEVQPIERIWAMVKNPIAYNPDPEETASTLREKLVSSLKNVPEKSLHSAWKKSVLQCITYQDELRNVDSTVDLDEVDEDIEMDSS